MDSWPVEIVQQRLCRTVPSGPSYVRLVREKYRIDRTAAEALAAFLRNYERDERSANRGYWPPSRIASSPATRTRRWS